MAYHISIRKHAEVLRRKGFSLNEIHGATGISKATLSVWLYNIELGNDARNRLLTKIKLGQVISAENKKRRAREAEEGFRMQAERLLKKVSISKTHARFICAMLYWCEGNKNPKSGMRFINSDPNLVKTFLRLLRTGFDLDESKFHPTLHLHTYHNPIMQLDFWSEVTHIDKKQFTRPYLKPNTGINKREGYPGCISVVYQSTVFARELQGYAKAFVKTFS